MQLPAGIALKPPVSIEDLKADTEYDPEGAEEFVAFIQAEYERWGTVLAERDIQLA